MSSGPSPETLAFFDDYKKSNTDNNVRVVSHPQTLLVLEKFLTGVTLPLNATALLRMWSSKSAMGFWYEFSLFLLSLLMFCL